MFARVTPIPAPGHLLSGDGVDTSQGATPFGIYLGYSGSWLGIFWGGGAGHEEGVYVLISIEKKKVCKGCDTGYCAPTNHQKDKH